MDQNANTFKALNGLGAQFDYAVFVSGEDDLAGTICSMSAVAPSTVPRPISRRSTTRLLVKSILSDNILLGDIYLRAKELHCLRGALRRVPDPSGGHVDVSVVDVVQGCIRSPDRLCHSISETDVAL